MALSSIGPLISPEATAPAREAVQRQPGIERSGETPSASGLSFADMLGEVMRAEAEAKQASDDYAVGKSQAIHETMIAMEKSSISFTLLVSVRNKLLEAYREVMRMS